MTDARRCPDCQVDPGQRHEPGCDVALCVLCGLQQIQCDPEDEHGYAQGATEKQLPPMQTWTGIWPGVEECREFGWFARWTIVTKYSPDGRPDSGPSVELNRLRPAEARGEIVWSRERERYVRTVESP